MKIERKRMKESKCPVCGSDNTDYGDLNDVDGDHVYQEASCLDCESSWIEPYRLVATPVYTIKNFAFIVTIGVNNKRTFPDRLSKYLGDYFVSLMSSIGTLRPSVAAQAAAGAISDRDFSFEDTRHFKFDVSNLLTYDSFENVIPDKKLSKFVLNVIRSSQNPDSIVRSESGGGKEDDEIVKDD
ncbi:MAG: hypothetical protein SVK08_00255 [Halobacteriota archaeon]|nr:hypothetical protein [Halobacteriota archaeon]